MNLDLTPEMKVHLWSIVISDEEEITHLEALRRQILEAITECWCEIHCIDVKLEKLMENEGGSCEG